MARKGFLDEVSRHLGRRSLVWLGVRGADASALLQIPQFSKVFSTTAPLESVSAVSEVCLETMQKKRNNIHTWDIDQDNSAEIRKMHALLIAAFSKPVAVLTYRPDKFLAAAYFPQAANVKYLGLFYEQQTAFENKSWVESELRKYGVRTLPWSYYEQHKMPDLNHLLSQGPIVVRSSSSSHGGVGILIIREQNQIDFSLNDHNAFYAISRYLEPNISLNVNACLFPDGTVSLHGPSVQLVGIPSCTGLQLGYCGNDFTQVRNLDINILDELETMTFQVGKWLVGMGYLGVFGLDAIVYRHHVYLAELNPRFQGSSTMAAALDEELGRPDVYLSHMAAYFGMPAPAYMPLRELAKQQREISQIFCYNRILPPVFYTGTLMDQPDAAGFMHLPARDVEVEHEGMLFKAVVAGSVTTDGHSILKRCENRIAAMTETFSPQTPA